MAGGSKSPRAAAEVSALGDAFSSSTSAEFSGSWNVSALIDRKADGSFYPASELSGTQMEVINQSNTLPVTASYSPTVAIGLIPER